MGDPSIPGQLAFGYGGWDRKFVYADGGIRYGMNTRLQVESIL